MNEPLNKIDPEFLEQSISTSYKTMHKCIKVFKDNPGCLNVAQEIRHQLEEFKPKVPLIQGLRNPGMRNRHWESLSDDIGKLMLNDLDRRLAYSFLVIFL